MKTKKDLMRRKTNDDDYGDDDGGGDCDHYFHASDVHLDFHEKNCCDDYGYEYDDDGDADLFLVELLKQAGYLLAALSKDAHEDFRYSK